LIGNTSGREARASRSQSELFSITTLEKPLAVAAAASYGDGKLIEHWDEPDLLEVFQQIGAATVRKVEGQ
jgi:hypothetical protein